RPRPVPSRGPDRSPPRPADARFAGQCSRGGNGYRRWESASTLTPRATVPGGGFEFGRNRRLIGIGIVALAGQRAAPLLAHGGGQLHAAPRAVIDFHVHPA